MVVGKIWDSEYPWDVRVEKVCQALHAAGHRVHLVCRNRRREAGREDLVDLTVHRMPPLEGLLHRWDAALSFPAFMSPRWYVLARDTFRREGVNVILSRDLPLAPLALAVGRVLRRPVVLDIAEHYPGLLRDLYNRQDFRLVNLLVRNPILAAWLERLVVRRADGVLVVVEEMAQRLARLGAAPERITVVSNTPRADRSAMLSDTVRQPRAPGAPLRLVYLGKIERARGLHVVLEAIARLRSLQITVRFDVYGDGIGAAAERRLTERLGLDDRVTFHGHQPYDQVLRVLPTFDAAVIPHHATDHCSFTVPNKLFDCMAAGLPVIVSAMPPAARIVREVGCGLVFRDRDPADLARVLRDFPGPEEQIRMMGAGRRAIRDTYHWDRDAALLVRALERAAGAAGREADHLTTATSAPGSSLRAP